MILRNLVLPLLCVTGFLAPPAVSAEYPFRVFNARDGLLSESIRWVTQDARGYLWVGTTDGVSIFDGYRFISITPANGLSNSYVNCLLPSEKSAGMMWIATNGGGVCQWMDGKLTIHHLGTEALSNRVNVMAEDSQGVLWCGTDWGVFRVAGGMVEPFLPDTAWGYVPSLQVVSDSLIIFAAESSLLFYNPRSRHLRRMMVPLKPGTMFERILAIDGSSIWAAAGKGQVFELRDGIVRRKFDLGHPFPVCFVHDERRGLLLGTNAGFYRLPEENEQGKPVLVLSTDNGLPDNMVTSACVDREGNLWIGGRTAGLFLLRRTNMVRFQVPVPGELPSNDDAAVSDRRSHIWCVSTMRLMELWRSETGQWLTKTHLLSRSADGGQPRAIKYDTRRDILWILREHGRVESYRITPAPEDGSMLTPGRVLLPRSDYPEDIVLRIKLAPNGEVYLSLQTFGVALLDPVRTPALRRIYDERGGLVEGDIRSLLEDRSGTLWCGTYVRGLVRVPVIGDAPMQARSFTVADGLADNSVRALSEDREGRIWIGTLYGGLSVFDGQMIRSYTVKDGLLSNTVWSIAEDEGGVLWLGTHRGLQSLHYPSGQFTSYGELSDIQVTSCGITPNRLVWAYSQGEVRVFDASQMLPALPPSPVYITRFEVNGQDTRLSDEMEFSSWQSNISIEYIGISLTSPEGVRYQYRIEEIDNAWQPAGAHQRVTLAALRPGRYTFLVKAINADGVESVRAAVVRFSILSPFWLRWWFVLGGVLLVASTVGLIVLTRVRRLLEIERIRSRIATDLHDDIGASLTRITVYAEAVRSALESRRSHAQSERLHALLTEIGATSRELVDAMSDVVWSIDPRNDSFESLLLRMKTASARLLEAKGLEYDIDIAKDVATLRLPLEFRRNVLLVFKEALNNVIRHSGATRVGIGLRREGDWMYFSITDNGRGFDVAAGGGGNGLRNMGRRAGQLDGEIDIHSSVGAGTSVQLKARLP